MMFKKINLILTLTLLFFLTANCLANGPLELDEGNIVSPQNATVSLDGRLIHPELLKYEGILYASGKDLLATFGYRYTYDETSQVIKINDITMPAWRSAYINRNNSKEIFLPLLETLSLLNIRYLYSDLYGSAVIAIRTVPSTDYSFTPDQNYIVPQTNSIQANNQTNYTIQNQTNNYNNPVPYNNPVSYNNYNNQVPNVPGYNGPINSVPDLLAKTNYDSAVRGWGTRTRLGFYSVYGVEPQPYGTGFPYGIGPYSNNYYYYPSPYYSRPCGPNYPTIEHFPNNCGVPGVYNNGCSGPPVPCNGTNWGH